MAYFERSNFHDFRGDAFYRLIFTEKIPQGEKLIKNRENTKIPTFALEVNYHFPFLFLT